MIPLHEKAHSRIGAQAAGPKRRQRERALSSEAPELTHRMIAGARARPRYGSLRVPAGHLKARGKESRGTE